MCGFFLSIFNNIMDNPGLSGAVQEALQRRSGAPTPMLSQVSPGAPMQQDVPPPINMSDLTATSAPPAPTAAPSQKYEPQTQEDLIIMALIEQLKNSGRLKKEELKLAQGQVQAPQVSQSAPQSTEPAFMQAPSMAVSSQQSGYPFGQF